MPDFTWDHVILILSVLALATACHWGRGPRRSDKDIRAV